jgi:cysteinyl-tRNA synthetase
MARSSPPDRIYFTSTMTGKLVCLSKKSQAAITMYVCGVTPYDDAHIGHGRCYVTFDIVYRLLNFFGFSVTYCRNITDIDDKLLRRAESELGSVASYHEIAKKFTTRFQEDVARLGCLPPHYEPRVTNHIPEIIARVAELIASGHAYVSDGSVYFRINSYPSYGELSGQHIADMCVGARVEINEEKENPLDFALWKGEPEGTFWKSPWGWGRPGWHIECSALALKYLGTTIDIHGGGMDLIFPHHENERAQSECITQTTFARLWMHNAFVRVKQEKMSKSLGNFVTLRDAFSRVNPTVLRYYYSIHHYRNPLDFSWDDIEAAEKSYRRIINILNPQGTLIHEYKQLKLHDIQQNIVNLSEQSQTIINRMIDALVDDLNVQAAWGIFFEHAADIRADPQLVKIIAQLVQCVMGLSLEPLPTVVTTITPEIQSLLNERQQAREQRNWKRADEIRDELIARNVAIHDDKI